MSDVPALQTVTIDQAETIAKEGYLVSSHVDLAKSPELVQYWCLNCPTGVLHGMAHWHTAKKFGESVLNGQGLYKN